MDADSSAARALAAPQRPAAGDQAEAKGHERPVGERETEDDERRVLTESSRHEQRGRLLAEPLDQPFDQPRVATDAGDGSGRLELEPALIGRCGDPDGSAEQEQAARHPDETPGPGLANRAQCRPTGLGP